MEEIDRLILEAIGEKVFIPERVALMLKAFRQRLKDSRCKHDDTLCKLKHELDAIQQGTEKTLSGGERGAAPTGYYLQGASAPASGKAAGNSNGDGGTQVAEGNAPDPAGAEDHRNLLQGPQ